MLIAVEGTQRDFRIVATMLACIKNLVCRFKRSLTILCLGTVVPCLGCKVGPDYATPPTAMQPHWSMASHAQVNGEPAQLATWWQHFHDPTLDQLIAQAIDQNLTLREAGWRVLEARARRNVVAGNLAPQLQVANGSFSRSRLSRNSANFFSFPGVFEPDLNPENWSVGASAAWELDFWGRFRRAVEVADASLDATCAAYDEARVLLLAEVAQTYVELRTIEQRLALARRNLEIQEATLRIAQQKKDAGIGNGLDIAQAESNIGRTGATLPTLEIQRLQASYRLCLLLGRQPADLTHEFGTSNTIPIPPQGLAFGIPADLLRRRPDVRRVERELAAQSARIGIAEADFYPHISLTGNIGVAAEDFGKLFSTGSGVGVISPNFSWNLLNYGRIKNNVKAEQAAFQVRCNAYQNTVLAALREAEDAQVAYIYGFDRVEYLRRAAAGAASAVEKGESLYNAGSIDFGRVYILQSSLLLQQDELAAAEGDLAISLIQMFKSLGGGWENYCPTSEISFAPMQTFPVQQPTMAVDFPEVPNHASIQSFDPLVMPSIVEKPHDFVPLVPEVFEFPNLQ